MNKGQSAPTHAKMRDLQHAVKSARIAASMLLKKAQVFDMYLKDYGKKLQANSDLMEHIMQEAFIVLAAARYVYAPASLTVFTECMVPEVAAVYVVSFADRFFGNAQFFNILESEEKEIWPMAGLSKGATEIQKTKEIFRKAAEVCVGQISLRNIFVSLCKAKEVEMRKVVVIDKIVIPQMQDMIASILNYLDDVERDDNYRYKLVKKRYSRKMQPPPISE